MNRQSSIDSQGLAAELIAIRDEFDITGDGRAALLARSKLVDQIIVQLYKDVVPAGLSGSQDFCLVAAGGYGREELFPCSDVDLLFLYASQRAQEAHRADAAAISRSLWDMGLRVGGGSRTLAECYVLDRKNLEFTVSLLDCRYVAGDRQVFSHLRQQVVPHVVARDHQDLVRDLVEMTRQRHAKHGGTLFHLEPDVKGAPGGLRDYQVARWLGLIIELEARQRWAAPEAHWPAELHAATACAFDFLAATRCFLHYERGRDDNLLTYELQERAASLHIGWAVSEVQPAPPPGARSGPPVTAERWMRGYFRHVRAVDRLATQMLSEVAPSRSSLYGLFQDWRSRLSNPDFSVVRGRIFPRQPAAAVEDPALALRVFEMVARHGLELSGAAERWVEKLLPRLGQPPAGLWRQLCEILILPYAAEALRAMHRLGLLAALFPEFRSIDAAVIRDFYHRYTVDEHSFIAIRSLHELGARGGRAENARETSTGARTDGNWERRFAEILAELEQPELLYFALLFHDVGKGAAADHIEGSLAAVEAIFSRLDVGTEEHETVRFLIARHLEMSATLQRRDIFDPETIRALAGKVGTPERLKMLCLFTYADIKAVNPEALTPWKAEMLWRLYVAAFNHLTRSLDEERLRAGTQGMSKAELVLPLLPPAGLPELNAFLEGFPRRYLETHTPEQIANHFLKAGRLAAQRVQVILRRREHFHELTVITHDRPFLFASITGTLAAWGMNILKADAFSNAAGIVLDTFRFTDLHRTLELNPPEVVRFEKSIVEVLTGQESLEALLTSRVRPDSQRPAKLAIPTQVRFDDTSSSHSTLLELITWDRPGLLYEVSKALAELGCNIEVALIDTEGQKVIDVFYLTFGGRKLLPDRQERVRQSLLEAVGENPAAVSTDQSPPPPGVQ